MEKLLEITGLQTKINGKKIPDYIAELIERNEKQQIEIERGKLTISALKQINNYSRIALDVEKLKHKLKEEHPVA